MMPRAFARAGSEQAAGGSARLLLFLGASLAVHGLLAVVFSYKATPSIPVSRTAPVSPSAGAEVVWFEGAPAAPAPPVARVDEAEPAPRVPAPKRSPRAVSPVKQLEAVPIAPTPSEASPPAEASRQEGEAQAPSAPSPEASVAEAVTGGSVQGTPGTESASPDGAGASLAGLRPGSSNIPRGGVAGIQAREDLKAYAQRLSSKVARERRYPASAARLGMEGTARVRIRVHRDGSLVGSPLLVTSTGHEVLDAEALRMVEAAAPFGPLPDSASRPEAEFIIPVHFSLPR